MKGERWLPGEPEPSTAARYPPWLPRTLAGQVEADQLENSWAYVVVDEIVGDRVGLSVSAWPGVDERGRLHFPESTRDELVGTSRTRFQVYVDRNRRVLVITAAGEVEPGLTEEALRQRPLRIGDAFAIPFMQIELAKSVSRRQRDDPRVDAQFGFGDPFQVYDISSEAREQAKLAGAAAVAPPLDADEAERFLRGDEGPEEEEPEDEGPDDEGPGGSQPPAAPAPTGTGPGEELHPEEQVEEARA